MAFTLGLSTAFTLGLSPGPCGPEIKRVKAKEGVLGRLRWFRFFAHQSVE